MAHIVDIFLQNATGFSDARGNNIMFVVFFTYCELAVTILFSVLTCLSVVNSADLSIRLYGVLCLFIETHMCIYIAIRIYCISQFREMYQRSQDVGIPENYRWKIALVIKHFFIMPSVFVAFSMLYTISLDSVRMGDPFTFPSADVLPIKTTNVTIYVCKYIVYTLPAYIAHFEACFLNVSFMYFTGVVKRHFEILEEQVKEAMVNEDEKKLKIAIKHHQEVLKYFKDMETLHEKPILLTIEFCGLYIGLTSCFMLQVIQGFIHQLLLAICIVSSVTGLITITIYCTYGSNISDLHNGILNELFEHRSCYSRNKSFKSLSLMMMTRASIPLEFKAGSIFTISLNLLIKILKFSFSMFNALITLINRQFKETAV